MSKNPKKDKDVDEDDDHDDDDDEKPVPPARVRRMESSVQKDEDEETQLGARELYGSCADSGTKFARRERLALREAEGKHAQDNKDGCGPKCTRVDDDYECVRWWKKPCERRVETDPRSSQPCERACLVVDRSYHCVKWAKYSCRRRGENDDLEGGHEGPDDWDS